jgi:class 3 adenylate cyclase
VRILIAEDDFDSRLLLQRTLEKDDFRVVCAEDGQQAWELFQEEDFCLVLTDWQMPRMGGLELIEKICASAKGRYVYLILVTARDTKTDLVKAMDAGADDYVTKPYDKNELLARVRAGMRIIELEQNLQEKNRLLSAEQENSERLLLSIFPRPIAERLKKESGVIADSFTATSVLFADINNFSTLAAKKSPLEIVELLNQLFCRFDRLADRFGLEKIKTIGDSYMVAGGILEPRPDHATAVADMALAMLRETVDFDWKTGEPLQLRIGIDSGPVIAGVIGNARLAYDLWGETVQNAEQLKNSGLPGSIQISSASFELLQNDFTLEERGEFYLPGSGEITTYLLTGAQESP